MLAFFVAVVAALRSTTRSRVELTAEILALRHQLAVLRQWTPTRLRLVRRVVTLRPLAHPTGWTNAVSRRADSGGFTHS